LFVKAKQPDWWPSWEGETLVIVASGPSAKEAPLELAKGRAKVIAINTSWRLVPWADILFACDQRWWTQYHGCPEFGGLRLTIDKHAAREFGLGYAHCMKPDDRVFLEPKGTVGWGGNSGFHCLNLAIQFAVKRVLLVGYDMRIDRGPHWHGEHPRGMHNPSAMNVERWRRAVDNAAKIAKAQGVEVINCSSVSALQNYPKMGFAEALEC
jgi:hypothetical protein